MPTHILVNKLGLTYKSTIGISKATLPDVCKTPTPGGPVPVPYPNFANQSSLRKGTKTVKAKNNMIAVKGSEYGMSFGDEAGTVGGVKSSTFKKETSWITYSFDVKMEGKNACRHTDKKFHNHKNTVNLGGNTDPGPPPVQLSFDCNEKKNGKQRWDECQQADACAMVAAFNEIPKEKIKRVSPSPAEGPSREYRASLDRFENNFAELVGQSPPDEAEIKKKFYTNCRYCQWKNGNPEGSPSVPARNPRPPRTSRNGGGLSMNPDHVHDAGLGGSLDDLDNCKWVNSRVNKSLGKSMGIAAKSGEYQPGAKIELPNCDCENISAKDAAIDTDKC